MKNNQQHFGCAWCKATTNNLQAKFGFTLIELLVVISIIAILITVGVTAFSTAQTKSRDSKRKSDIRDIQVALEQYYSVCGYNYPTPDGSTFFQSVSCADPSIAILPTVPEDPRGTTPYYCGPTPDVANCNSGTTYSVCAMLEGETNNIFCLQNKQ